MGEPIPERFENPSYCEEVEVERDEARANHLRAAKAREEALAENHKLREALERITEHGTASHDRGGVAAAQSMQRIARAALDDSAEEGNWVARLPEADLHRLEEEVIAEIGRRDSGGQT